MASASATGIREQLATFKAGRVLELTLPNETEAMQKFYPDCKEVVLSVVDSWVPCIVGKHPLVAIMFVPNGRQHDMLFSTDIGLRRLLFECSNLTRLIVVKPCQNSPKLYDWHKVSFPDDSKHELVARIKDICFGVDDPLLLTHLPEIWYGTQLIKAGEVNKIYAEDLELKKSQGFGVDLRRQMRYKHIPHIFQADCVLVATKNGVIETGPLKDLKEKQSELVFLIDIENLATPLQAMLNGLKVIENHLNMQETLDARVRVLSLGVGVGILERIFIKKFGAEIVGVDKDPDVMSFADTYFRSSLVDDEWKGLNLISGYCALNVLSELAGGISKSNPKLVEACNVFKGLRYDVVLLDIIDHDDLPGVGACAPPRHFVDKSTFDKIKGLLDPEGALVMQVIVPDICYEKKLLKLLGDCFKIVFKIALDDKSKYVLVATDSLVFASGENKPGRTSNVLASLVTRSFNIDEAFY